MRLSHGFITGMAIFGLAIRVTAAHQPGSRPIIDVSNRYIIALKPDANVEEHMVFVKQLHAEANGQGSQFEGVTHQYNISNFQAYAGHISASVMQPLESRDDIERISPDRVMTIPVLDTELQGGVNASWDLARPSETKQCGASWALHSISHRRKRTIGPCVYIYDRLAGAGTYAYVVDSGINTAHEEFEGRASLGYNAVKRESPADGLGHGTHVAGIIGSKTYGVAKKCRMISVKVLESGSGSTSEAVFLDGYKWAVNDIIRNNRAAKAVINVSLTSERDPSINQAIDGAYSLGITTVVSAGNNALDASHFSPGSARGALVVSGTEKNYARWDMANTGPTVAIFGPGGGIKSTGIGGVRATATRSGTSYAAAFVSGIILYSKALHSLPNARQTREYILRTASRGLVDDPAGAQNLFAYNGNGA